MPEGIDLVDLFQTAAGALQKNRTELNQADSYNKNHGDNMVEIFEVITQAMKAKQNADAPTQLEYAAQLLRQKSNSGSASVYAEGLASASKQVSGNVVSPDMAMNLLQTLMNGGQGAADQQSGGGIGDLLGGLLGGDDGELDSSDLLGAGLAFLNSKQSGDDNLEALSKAFVSTTQMSNSDHRSQSGQLVTNAVLQLLSSQLKK